MNFNPKKPIIMMNLKKAAVRFIKKTKMMMPEYIKSGKVPKGNM
jgi:hypothetical protein